MKIKAWWYGLCDEFARSKHLAGFILFSAVVAIALGVATLVGSLRGQWILLIVSIPCIVYSLFVGVIAINSNERW